MIEIRDKLGDDVKERENENGKIDLEQVADIYRIYEVSKMDGFVVKMVD